MEKPERIRVNPRDYMGDMSAHAMGEKHKQRVAIWTYMWGFTTANLIRLFLQKDAYFSDRGHPFQSDRGRCFSVIVDGQERHASPGLNVSQSSTISLKRSVEAPVLSPVLGFD